MLSAKTSMAPDPRSNRRMRSSPVLAMNSFVSSPFRARPFAPKGGKPAVASRGWCVSVVTAQEAGQLAAPAILKMAPWNESDTKRSPMLLKASALGAGKPLELRRAEIADIDLPGELVELEPQERRGAKVFHRDQAAVPVEPEKLVAVRPGIERCDVEIAGLGIRRDPLGEAHAIGQHDEPLRRIPLDNDVPGRPRFAA